MRWVQGQGIIYGFEVVRWVWGLGGRAVIVMGHVCVCAVLGSTQNMASHVWRHPGIGYTLAVPIDVLPYTGPPES